MEIHKMTWQLRNQPLEFMKGFNLIFISKQGSVTTTDRHNRGSWWASVEAVSLAAPKQPKVFELKTSSPPPVEQFLGGAQGLPTFSIWSEWTRRGRRGVAPVIVQTTVGAACDWAVPTNITAGAACHQPALQIITVGAAGDWVAPTNHKVGAVITSRPYKSVDL